MTEVWAGLATLTERAGSRNMTIESLAFDFMAEPGYLHLTAILDPYPIRT